MRFLMLAEVMQQEGNIHHSLQLQKPTTWTCRSSRNPAFQKDISDLTADCARLGVDGINLDFIRTDYTLEGGVPADRVKNDASIEKIVRMIYEKVKAVNSGCIVSSTTVPYYDITNPVMIRGGRKAINWANAGIQDIIFGFEYGIPPNPKIMQFKKIRELVTTDVPYIAMVGNWTRDGVKGRNTQYHKRLRSVYIST